MTDPLGQSQVIPYIKKLSLKGYRFTLLSCEKKDRFDKYQDQIKNILAESNIEWHPIHYHKSPPVLSTVYDFNSLLRLAVKLHKKEKFELLHCRSYISSLIGLHMKKKYGVPFLFDMRGFWADERVDGGLWRLGNPIYKWVYKYFKRKEEEFLEHCAAAISLTEAGKNEMEKWEVCKKYNTPIQVIPCSADFSLFVLSSNDSGKNSVKKDLGINENAFVLSYLGSIGTWYLLDEMLDFFNELLLKYPHAVFLFITPDDPEFVKSRAREKKIPLEKIIVRYAQRNEVVKNISISDASIFFIRPCFSKLSSSPTKLGELLAMGIPVICNEGIGDVKEIVAQTQGGLTINSFNKESYGKVILNLDQLKNFNKVIVRENALKYYDLELAAEKYGKVYDFIFNKKNEMLSNKIEA